MLTPPLKEHEVPHGIINELKANYSKVEFDLDSEIDEGTRSLKCCYMRQIDDAVISEWTVTDPETMKLVTIDVDGYRHQTYIVRVNEVDDGVIVKRVLESGIIVK